MAYDHVPHDIKSQTIRRSDVPAMNDGLFTKQDNGCGKSSNLNVTPMIGDDEARLPLSDFSSAS